MRAVASSESTASWSGLTDAGTETSLLHFKLDGADGGESDSKTMFLPDSTRAQLCETPDCDASAGDAIVVSGFLVSAGGGAAATATVAVRVAQSADMSGAAVHQVGSLTAGQTFSLRIDGLVPETSNFWQVVATDANGRQDITPVVGEMLPGRAVLSLETSASENCYFGTFEGALEYIGAGALGAEHETVRV